MTKEDVKKYITENGNQELVVTVLRQMHAEGAEMTIEELDRRVKAEAPAEQIEIPQEMHEVPEEVSEPTEPKDVEVIRDETHTVDSKGENSNVMPVLMVLLTLVGTVISSVGMQQIMQTATVAADGTLQTDNSTMIFFYVGALITTVISIAADWKIFKKAGKPGWASIVPGYNLWVMFDVIWGRGVSMFRLLIPIYNIYWAIRSMVELGSRFGKSTGFKVGLVLLPFIFMVILGFDNSEYKNE